MSFTSYIFALLCTVAVPRVIRISLHSMTEKKRIYTHSPTHPFKMLGYRECYHRSQSSHTFSAPFSTNSQRIRRKFYVHPPFRSFQDVTEVVKQALDLGFSHTTPPPVRFTRLCLSLFSFFRCLPLRCICLVADVCCPVYIPGGSSVRE